TVGYSAESYVNLAPNVLTQVWDVADQKVVSTSRAVQRQTARAHGGDVSADGKWWAQAESGGGRLLDLETGRRRTRWQSAGADNLAFTFDGTNSLTFSPDGNVLWSNSSGTIFPQMTDASGVRAWQVPTGREVFTTQAHRQAVRHVSFAGGTGGLLVSVDD